MTERNTSRFWVSLDTEVFDRFRVLAARLGSTPGVVLRVIAVKLVENPEYLPGLADDVAAEMDRARKNRAENARTHISAYHRAQGRQVRPRKDE